MAYQLLNPFTLFAVVFLTLLARFFAPKSCAQLFERPSDSQPRWQCRLTDVYILLFQLVVAGWITWEPDEEYGRRDSLAGMAVLWSLQSLWWFWGIQALSWSKIDDPLRRWVVLGILVPIVFGWALIPCMVSMLILVFGAGLILVPAIAVFVLALACRRVASWAEKPVSAFETPGPVLRWVRICVCLIFFLAATPAVTFPMWCGFTIPPLYYKIQVRRFRREMQWRADIPAIQAWLAQNNSKNTTTTSSRELLDTELPRCVSSITSRVHLTDQKTLVFGSGSGFGHWGMEVGPKGSGKPDWSERKYSVPLADGAWVWIDDH